MEFFKLAVQLGVSCILPLSGCARSDDSVATPKASVSSTAHKGSKHQYVNRSVSSEAADAAAIGGRGTPEDSQLTGHISHRITPRPYKIGGVDGTQGGVAAKIPQPNGKTLEAYNVFTGYTGRRGDENLPYVFVDMTSFTRMHAPELAEDPPPFEQSFGRLETLLKSIRFRTTESTAGGSSPR